MFCKKCGSQIKDGAKFCTVCGQPVMEEKKEEPVVEQVQTTVEPTTATNVEPVVQTPVQPTTQPVNNYNPQPKKKTPIGLIIGLAVGGFFLLMIIIGIIVLVTALASSKKMVCESNEGNITIMYNKKNIIGYTADGMSYDLDGQKEIAKQKGIDNYITEFNDWFVTNTTGTCKINGKVVESTKKVPTPSNKPTNNTKTTETKTKTIGSSKYGYVDVPTNWYKFYDIDGNDSLQYSYASQFIISLNVIDDNTYTAKEYASNYYYNKQNDTDITGLSSATVKIGKNKEYTAYQVYMYYPDDATYLVTYWFEAEDGYTHYIALEGPEKLGDTKITDLTVIPESFRLKNDAI